jgi:membrane protein
MKRTAKQVNEDKLTTWAAALTYYGILSLFPALLVLVSALRLVGKKNQQAVLDYLEKSAPGPSRSLLTTAIHNLQAGAGSTAGVLAIVGVLAALWSASGYVSSFMQAANAIYDVPEGRPFWKKIPIRLALTIATGVIVAASALAVVLSGGLARRVGSAVGLGSQAVMIWNIAKWPVIVVLISLIFAVLYWAAPNAKHGGFRWVTPGSLLAVIAWIVASGLFALYVTNFGSYNKTYGTIAGIIIFLVWLWLTNLAILFGCEFDAEIQRARAIEAGRDEAAEPYMDLRDTKKVDPQRDSDL